MICSICGRMIGKNDGYSAVRGHYFHHGCTNGATNYINMIQEICKDTSPVEHMAFWTNAEKAGVEDPFRDGQYISSGIYE